jgi:hypothetical protein
MSFGIRHTFRTQHISRKVARNNQQNRNTDEENSSKLSKIEENNSNISNTNVFDGNQNYFVNNVLNRSQTKVQNPLLVSVSSNYKNDQKDQKDNLLENSKNLKSKNSNLVSARLNLFKNHNRGVTKTEDHF